jgi:hypothetical protein
MPLLQPVLYVENNVGLRFCRAFNEFSLNHGWGAVYQHHVHPGMQRAQNGDEWWIEDISEKGYALLTCDLAIATTASERRSFNAFLLGSWASRTVSTTAGSRCVRSLVTGTQ